MDVCKELRCKNLCLVQEDELGNFLRLLLTLFLVISCFYKLTTVSPAGYVETSPGILGAGFWLPWLLCMLCCKIGVTTRVMFAVVQICHANLNFSSETNLSFFFQSQNSMLVSLATTSSSPSSPILPDFHFLTLIWLCPWCWNTPLCVPPAATISSVFAFWNLLHLFTD